MDTYAHGHHPSVVRSHARRGIADSAAYLLPSLGPGLRVLDVGCGPGSITRELAERFPGSQFVGVDREPAVLRTGDLPNLRFEVGDAYQLAFPDASFDVVHAHQVLQHLGDPVAALREFRRVVRPGGIVAARDVDYEGLTWYPRLPELDRWLEIYLQIARQHGGEPAAARHLRAWFRAAGFTDLQVTGSVWTYASEEQVTNWGQTWRQRAIESDYAKFALELGLANREELAEISRGWDAWSHHPDAWFQLPHGEVIAAG
ncbi:methyltransferase domain-containing protein [Actinomyces sp. F1_1611]